MSDAEYRENCEGWGDGGEPGVAAPIICEGSDVTCVSIDGLVKTNPRSMSKDWPVC